MDKKEQLWSISELSRELNITTRTIRFYEDRELLSPQRAGNSRIYNYQDRARLKLILRGKRLGFSLEEIREYIELYDTDIDPLQSEQLTYLLQIVRKKCIELEKQQQDLQQMLHELKGMAQECQNHLENK